MEAEKCSGLYWLCMEAENRSCAGSSPVTEPPAQPIDEMSDSQLGGVQETVGVNSVPAGNEAPAVVNAEVKVGERGADKRRRGRPPKGEANPPAKRRKKKEDEDVCFICFDGGSLVLCDRRDCPKAYHPACIKRDEAFFRSKAKWNCGWHICSKCQKSAHYMCYTCTYSLCKTCTKDADFLCVRENKGFCSTCMRIVKLIENIDQGNKAVQVDFDDKSSWEYLFKVYWICLKEDLSLTLDELTHAKNPWRAAGKVVRRERSAAVYYVGNNGMMTREHPKLPCKGNCYTPVKPVCDSDKTSVISTWASKELLDFVADMKNGDTSVLSQLEVQALLFDYIKTNNLRDPQQRSEIICDSKLVNLFRKPRVRHFEMLSLLEFHFLSKDDSQKDEFEGDIVDPVVSQVEDESNNDNLLMISENHKHKIHIKDEKGGNKDMWNEGKDACEKPGNQVDSSGSANNGQNNQACLKTESLSGVKSETSVASLSTGSTPSANDREAENSWRYRDPNGKVQGPFGIVQLHKWSTTGIFPPDMRIWSINNEEGNSVLLSDVLKGQAPLQNNLSLSPQDIKGTSESRSHHCDGPWSGSVNSTGIDAHSNGKLEFVKGNGPAPHSSDWSTPAINNDPQIENSSKCWDAPKVNNSYSDQPQVHCAERSSAFTERPHETSVHQATGNVGQRWNSAPNYENWNSQGDMISETAGRQCREHQINNSQHYLGQPSAEGTLPPNFSVNSWNSHESHPQYTSMANITEPSEHKFSIDLQKFPTPMPKTSNGELEAQTIKEQQWQPSQNSVPDLSTHNMRSLTPKSSDSDEKADSRIQKMASPTNNYEKIQAIENKHSLSLNFPAQDSGPSWSSASSLVVGGGNQLSKKATKPSIEEWDSGFMSLSSLKPQDVASDHVATPTSKRDELAPPSPPDPVPNASSWLAMVTEPIEFSTLAEESVSDLLAEVDAMESHSDLASPNMVMDYGEELFHDNSKTDCFTSLRGLSSPLDQGKTDALSSSGDIRVPPQSTMRNEPLRASHNDILDPLKRPRKHSSTSSVMDVETKRFDTPVNQLESRSNRQFPTPPIKTRDLADIFNAPVAEAKYVDSGRGTKQGTLNSPGSTRRESGQGTPRGSGSKNRSNPAGLTGRESHQKHGGERLTSPRDRNFESGDSGFSKGRPSWSRQSSFGGGGGGGSHSRPPRGQRVCKFYESGFCRKGAFCDYLHP